MPRSKGATNKTESRPRVKKEYAPVSLTELVAETVTKQEKATVLPGRERSAEQLAVDKTVTELAYEFIRAGSPSQFRDQPVRKYTVAPEQVDTIKFMVDKACKYLNLKPKYAKPAWAEDGREVVIFSVEPRDPSQWVDSEPESEESTESTENSEASESTQGTTWDPAA